MVHDRTLSSQARQFFTTTRVIHLMGEVDAESVPAVGREIRRVCWSAPTTLLVDLTAVTFFGAAGLTLLVDIHRQTQLAGTALYLAVPPRIMHLLRITGLAEVFRTHGTVNQAMAAADESPPANFGQQSVAPVASSDVDVRKGLLRLVSD